jgi:hypothetical protein
MLVTQNWLWRYVLGSIFVAIWTIISGPLTPAPCRQRVYWMEGSDIRLLGGFVAEQRFFRLVIMLLANCHMGSCCSQCLLEDIAQLYQHSGLAEPPGGLGPGPGGQFISPFAQLTPSSHATRCSDLPIYNRLQGKRNFLA